MEPSQLTISIWKSDGKGGFTETRRSQTDVLPSCSLVDVLHFGTTGLTEEELGSYVLLANNGGEICAAIKACRIQQVNLYPLRDVYPSGELPWTHAVIFVGEYMGKAYSINEPLRLTLSSSGLETSYEGMPQDHGATSRRIERLMAQNVPGTGVLAVIAAPDLSAYLNAVPDDTERSNMLCHLLGGSGYGPVTILVLQPHHRVTVPYSCAFCEVRLGVGGLASHLERGRMLWEVLKYASPENRTGA